MKTIYIWSVLLENGTSKICRTDDISNIIDYSEINIEEIICITRIGYASNYEEKEEWIWC